MWCDRKLVAMLTIAVAALAPVGRASAQVPGSSEEGFYGSAEYLLWWLKDSPAPVPLVSTDTLDQPGAQVVLGGRDIDTGKHHGGRFTAGFWLTRDHAVAIEARYFFLPETRVTRTVGMPGTPGSPGLIVPFLCACPDPPTEAGYVLANPGAWSGLGRESLTTSMRGGELNIAGRVVGSVGGRLELLGGFRYLNLQERYSFFTNSPFVPPVAGDVFQGQDVFDARNDFYGGQIGVRGELRWGPWSTNGAVKVAVGAMRQRVDVKGSFVTSELSNPPFQSLQAFQGGIFAQPTNIGRHRRDVFGVVPEVTLNVGYDLTSWMTLFVGYTFLYANEVVRPGDQISRHINPSQSALLDFTATPSLSGPAVPAFKFRNSDFWAHGLNAGLAFRF